MEIIEEVRWQNVDPQNVLHVVDMKELGDHF
jgi:hypothetical protein